MYAVLLSLHPAGGAGATKPKLLAFVAGVMLPVLVLVAPNSRGLIVGVCAAAAATSETETTATAASKYIAATAHQDQRQHQQ